MTETITRLRAYRVALDPTTAQQDALSRHAGAARAGYNFHLAARVQTHRQWRQLSLKRPTTEVPAATT